MNHTLRVEKGIVPAMLQPCQVMMLTSEMTEYLCQTQLKWQK